MEILTCSDSTTNDCKNTSEIAKLLQKLYFTIYSIESHTNYNFSDELYKYYDAKDYFISQFALRIDEYQDNNVYLIINRISVNMNRWNLWRNPTMEMLVTEDIMPSWKSSKFEVNENCTIKNKEI